MEIYVDHAATDPRSVKAWLIGRDDDRALLYQVFRKKALRRNRTLSELELGELYEDAIANGWEKANQAKLAAAGFSLLANLAFAVWYLLFK